MQLRTYSHFFSKPPVTIYRAHFRIFSEPPVNIYQVSIPPPSPCVLALAFPLFLLLLKFCRQYFLLISLYTRPYFLVYAIPPCSSSIFFYFLPYSLTSSAGNLVLACSLLHIATSTFSRLDLYEVDTFPLLFLIV